jgi:hypothetical protein
MIGPSKRKLSFLELEALPPDLGDLSHPAIPVRCCSTAGADRCPPRPGLAPESALRLHPCRALPSAPASTSVEEEIVWEKHVVVVEATRPEKVIDAGQPIMGSYFTPFFTTLKSFASSYA